jgi:hypothetical protein
MRRRGVAGITRPAAALPRILGGGPRHGRSCQEFAARWMGPQERRPAWPPTARIDLAFERGPLRRHRGRGWRGDRGRSQDRVRLGRFRYRRGRSIDYCALPAPLVQTPRLDPAEINASLKNTTTERRHRSPDSVVRTGTIFGQRSYRRSCMYHGYDTARRDARLSALADSSGNSRSNPARFCVS